ncbi:hypothetical protein Lfee_0257 [Legionella feeleii]|uniref:Transmembrane protein n=2 Tax=Legionella feeleii TaxID=453 RepID=A0A0W0U9G9_9GAMM|nr:hypothetical protein [Legionella feeleii]KTD04169.1 hypothetical protein Lfee_0257 [Legionella feeleii]SPX60719.1 Uncharacterised protein [Legionella feeleii]
MNKYLKATFLSLIPALILGVGFYFLVSILNGMEEVQETSSAWIFIGVILFLLHFVWRNGGQNIFGKFLRYAAYECWLSPLCVIIYTITSISQANDSLGGAGAVGAGFGGVLLVFIFAIGGGLLGLVLYLISSSLLKNKKL